MSIDHSSFCQFEFSGSHLCRSIIPRFVSLSFRDRTYIDRSFLVLSVSVLVGVASISIDHLHVIFVSIQVFGTTPISIGHFPC